MNDAKQAIQRLEAETLAPRQEPMDLLRMAVERGNVDVGTLERLMVVRKELRAEQAEAEFNTAMSAFQAECPILIRGKSGHENRYNYTPLEVIVGKVTPLLQKYGFSHEEDSNVTEGWVEAMVTVKHRSGHSITKRFKVPAASNAGMSPQQKYGAAMTYATRYAFCAAFGIRTADKDTDCNPDSVSVTALKKTLWEILKPVRGTENNWNAARQWLTDECNMDPGKRIQDLDANELKAMIEAAKARIQ